MHHSINGIEFIEYLNCDKMDYIVDEYYKLRQRKGITRRKAILDMQDRYYFAAMMVKLGLADTSVGGAEAAYQFVLKPALEIIGTQKGVNQVVSGLHWIKDENRNYFIADTAVNIRPSASDLVDIVQK